MTTDNVTSFPREAAEIGRERDEALERARMLTQELHDHPGRAAQRLASDAEHADMTKRRIRRKAVDAAAPSPANAFVDKVHPSGTVENVRRVLQFLEMNQLVDSMTSEDVEDGRWLITRQCVSALQHVEAIWAADQEYEERQARKAVRS